MEDKYPRVGCTRRVWGTLNVGMCEACYEAVLKSMLTWWSLWQRRDNKFSVWRTSRVHHRGWKSGCDGESWWEEFVYECLSEARRVVWLFPSCKSSQKCSYCNRFAIIRLRGVLGTSCATHTIFVCVSCLFHKCSLGFTCSWMYA
jgi:hypothetical protein